MIQGDFSRKLLMSLAVSLAGLSMVTTGMTNSLVVLSLMRVCHGAMNSIANPLFFSLIGDYFPKNQRGTANSII